MTEICVICSEKTICLKCSNFKPSIQLIMELSKASNQYGKLQDKYEVAKNFIRKIVFDWECDPNHAEAILSELERMELLEHKQ